VPANKRKQQRFVPMKIWIFLSALCVVGCSSPKPPGVSVRPLPASTIGEETSASVRYPESLKAYHVGRYVEPQNQLVMHEHHTDYTLDESGSIPQAKECGNDPLGLG